MAILRRRSIVGRAAVAIAALVGVAGVAGCDSETANFIREIEAARGDCTMDALRASSEECVQMFERYSEIGSEAINTYIGGVRALDEALRRTGGLSLDTAGLGRALSDEFLPGATVPGVGANPGWLDPYATGPGTQYGGGFPGDYPGGYAGNDRPAGPMPDAYYDTPRADGAGDLPRTQRGVLLPPDVRLRRPWTEPEYDPRYSGGDLDRSSPGYWPGSGYGVVPGYGGMPGYQGAVPGYGVAPGYGVVPGYGAYGGYAPYGTAPGYQGYQGYPPLPGYPGYPNGGGYPGYPGYGPVPGMTDPRYPDPRYDPRYAPDGRPNDRTIQRSPRAYDP